MFVGDKRVTGAGAVGSIRGNVPLPRQELETVQVAVPAMEIFFFKSYFKKGEEKNTVTEKIWSGGVESSESVWFTEDFGKSIGKGGYDMERKITSYLK